MTLLAGPSMTGKSFILQKILANAQKEGLIPAIKDGLKYRVTLNKFKGTKVNLDDITKDDIVSVVVVKPSETETVDPFAGEVPLGQREKLVADFPEGEEETMDMDDVIDAVRKGASKEGDLEDYELEDRRMRMDFPLDRDEVGAEDAESCPYSDEEIDAEKADLDDDGEVSEYERKRGEAIAKAMQRPGEKEEEEDEEVAMSPQAIQQHLINQYRQKMQNQYSHERRNRYGY